LDEAAQQRAVELLRVHIGDAVAPAPLPMLDEIGKELAAPADAAFEEGEAQIGEAPRHSAEEQRLGDGLAGGSEMADMIIGEVAGRIAQPEASAASVKSGRDAELAASLPDGVVVEGAVEPELVIGNGKTAERRVDALSRRHQPGNAAAEHCNLRAELPRRKVELGDRLFGRMHRDDRGGGQSVAEPGEEFRRDDVEAADHGPPRLTVGDARDAEA